MIQLVKAQMAQLQPQPVAPAAAAAQPAPAAAFMTVEDIQSALNQLGANPQLNVNGDYDQATKAAVAGFQQTHNCDVDGWVGPETTAAIKAALAAPPAAASPDIMSVEDIQSALNKLGANPQLDVSGDYDQATKAAVAGFQKTHDCDADGWVGPQTIAAIKAALAKL